MRPRRASDYEPGHRNGKTLEVTFPVVWEIRDGKPYDVRVYLYDMEEHDEFWS